MKCTENEIKSGVLLKTTLVDFPELVSCAFFFKGCNLRCPYCYNTGLVLGGIHAKDDSYSSVSELFEHLEKRKNVLKGLVLSGGEPLLNPDIPKIIEKAKTLGYKIKLDTNGTFPDRLEKLISNENTKPNYIAMDLKTDLRRYYEKLSPNKDNANKDADNKIFEKLKKSIELISTFPTESREFRSVMVPGLIDIDTVTEISKHIPLDSRWFFSHFSNNNCINSDYQNILPYTKEQEEQILFAAVKNIPHASIR